MFSSLCISQVEFRFPGSEKLGPSRNGTEFSGYSDFPEKRVHSKRIPKFSKTFPGIFTIPFSWNFWSNGKRPACLPVQHFRRLVDCLLDLVLMSG